MKKLFHRNELSLISFREGRAESMGHDRVQKTTWRFFSAADPKNIVLGVRTDE